MDPLDVIDWLLDNGALMVLPTGSRVIGGARPESDWDFIALGQDVLSEALTAKGFTQQFSAPVHSQSWRLGSINVIVLFNDDTFNKWRDATFEAMHAPGRESRDVRVAIFQKHRIGDDYAEEGLHQHDGHAEEPTGRGEAASGGSGGGLGERDGAQAL
jgi:hypothetical protein